jgi:hypothetical protein
MRCFPVMVVVGCSKSELCPGRRKVYIVALWHTGLWILLYGTLLLLQMRIDLLLVYLLGHALSLFIIVAFFRALLSVKVGHCRVCSIDVTFLVCSWRSGQIFFALLLVFVCSERCVGPIPYRHIQATVLQALNSKYISSFWGNDLGSAG